MHIYTLLLKFYSYSGTIPLLKSSYAGSSQNIFNSFTVNYHLLIFIIQHLFAIGSYLACSNINNFTLEHSFTVVLSRKPIPNLSSLIVVMHRLGLKAALVREGGYSFRCRTS